MFNKSFLKIKITISVMSIIVSKSFSLVRLKIDLFVKKKTYSQQIHKEFNPPIILISTENMTK